MKKFMIRSKNLFLFFLDSKDSDLNAYILENRLLHEFTNRGRQ